MKLATVNHRLDFNIEGLLAQDVRENLTAHAPQSKLIFDACVYLCIPSKPLKYYAIWHRFFNHNLALHLHLVFILTCLCHIIHCMHLDLD